MSEWDVLDGDRHPMAEAVGPFPHRPFLETWWRHRGAGSLAVVSHGSSAAAVVTLGDTMEFAGDGEVTDYHAPLGPDPGGVAAAAVASATAGTRFHFDSMPGEVAQLVAAALGSAGIDVATRQHEAAMVLDLSAADPLSALASKQRHEVRRKVRRFSEALGEPRLVGGAGGFDAFVAMHRMADGDKGGFMTEATEEFFRDLLVIPGAVMDLLLTAAGDPVAATFGFVDEAAYYLYNSSFDPGAAAVSPGIVILKLLIERESEAGRRRFDLLKGDDPYKHRLGARPRALFSVEGVV